ncbi:MAG TPA: glycosyltransferase family 1 protein [Acidimicrobiales bacterium]|nr:glycosyltransferase family 1 protein [Acidimicrobiales bacterium]
MPGDAVRPDDARVGRARLRVALDVTAVPDRPVGAGHYILQLARGLSARPDVDLVVFGRSADRDRWAALVPEGNLVAEAPAARPLRLAWEQLRLGPLLAASGAAVHHGPHYTMPRRCPIPSVVTVHDLSFFDEPRWHERSKVLLFRRAITRAAREAAVVVCPSRVTADALRRWCRVDAEVAVVPHGVDTERFRPVEPQPGSDAARLAALDARLVGDGPLLVFVGTLEPRKDVPTLVRAFAAVASRHPDAHLVLAGGAAWGADDVEAAVVASGLGRRIVRTGYVGDEDVPALLRSATAVVYPSLYEGFGLPALEALACGAPLVTTRGTAMEEVAGASAVLVEPGDTDDLAGALDAALGGDGDFRAAAERRALGFEIVRRHTWDRSTDLHVAAYRRAHSAGVPSR